MFLNKEEILKKYEKLIQESNSSEPLCAFLTLNYSTELTDKFQKYLVDEKILDRPTQSIYSYFFDLKGEGKTHLANCFRYLVLEDFLNKHL